MTQQRIPYIIHLSVNATNDGPIIDLDYRFAPMQNYSIAGSLANGDTLTVLVSPVPRQLNAKYTITGDVANTTISNHTGFFVTVSTYSGTWADNINGPWAQLKVVKTGSNGATDVYVLG